MRSATINRILCATGLAALAAACTDAGGAPSGDAQLAFNLATRARPTSPVAAVAGMVTPETYTDAAGNTLTFDRVQIVLREVELENESVGGGCENAGGDNRESCAQVEIGPILVDLPLGTPGAARAFTATVPAGTYDKVEFQIRKPDDDPEDAAFIAEHPEFADISLRVEGRYNDNEPFVFTSRLEVDLELELGTPVVIDGSAATDLTLMVNLDAWFRSGDGNLLDPATADPTLVADNVQRSFEAFEDEDHSGSDDHGGEAGPDEGGPDDEGPSGT
jgi:hypothetical protein